MCILETVDVEHCSDEAKGIVEDMKNARGSLGELGGTSSRERALKARKGPLERNRKNRGRVAVR